MDRKNLSRSYKQSKANDPSEVFARAIGDESYQYVLDQIREQNMSDREIVRALNRGSQGIGETPLMESWLLLLSEYGLIKPERR